MFFKKLIHPEYFQGNRKKDRYFEGWYYKLVSTDDAHTIAFIPGVSINKKDPHAFIQVFISTSVQGEANLSTYYFRFPMHAFSYGYDDFYVQIDQNRFTKESVSISLENEEIRIHGDIKLIDTTPIQKNVYMPNIMGPFGYLSFMECYHGVVSMTHQLEGTLSIQSTQVHFDRGKGYIEKDWGKSFPIGYVWLQSNHFKDDKTSFMFSYADIPFLGFYFKGLIANLIYQEKEYRFATYNLTKVIKEELSKNRAFYRLKKRSWTLEIEAISKTAISLASPRNGQMIEQIKEGLSGDIRISLYHRDVLIYEDKGIHAGIEIMK